MRYVSVSATPLDSNGGRLLSHSPVFIKSDRYFLVIWSVLAIAVTLSMFLG